VLARPVLRGLYAAVIVVAVSVIAWNCFIQQANDQVSDILMRLRGHQPSAWAERIVLVAIDDRTVSRYGPLPPRRSVLARGLETLAQSRPRVLALDLILS
jgi:adenylate cyclase